VRRLIAAAIVTIAGCTSAGSVPCDGLFCPAGTRCGGEEVCLVEPGSCTAFAEGTPCERDELARGYCFEGTCAPGAQITGVAIDYPSLAPFRNAQVKVRDRPEVLPVDTNLNGFFDLVDVPLHTSSVIEVSFPETYPVITREVAINFGDVLIDVTYGGIPIIINQVLAMVAEAVGSTIASGRGVVMGEAFDLAARAPLAGVAVALTTAGCVGPIYFDDNKNPTSSATSTFGGSALFAFVDCPPGATELVATFPGRTCYPLAGVGTDPIPITIVEDRILFVGRLDCQP
jgi:hypothetical protein